MWRAAKSMRPGTMRRWLQTVSQLNRFTMNRIYRILPEQGLPFTFTSSTAALRNGSTGATIWHRQRRGRTSFSITSPDRTSASRCSPQYCDGEPGTVAVDAPVEKQDLRRAGLLGSRNSAPFTGSIYINTAEEVSGVPRLVSQLPALHRQPCGIQVMKIQEQLNRISDNYPLIPKVVPDGIFGESDSKCRPYLPAYLRTDTGRHRWRHTWYKIQDVYIAVTHRWRRGE